jgi:hypothetical protein
MKNSYDNSIIKENTIMQSTKHNSQNWLTTARTLLAGFILAGSSTLLASNAQAFVLLNGKTLPADATRTMGPGIHAVQSSSGNGAYSTDPACRRWIVDINIPSNSSGTGDDSKRVIIFDSSADLVANTKAVCQSTEIIESLYKKKPDGTFQTIGGGTLKGVWKASNLFPCQLYKSPGYVNFPSSIAPPFTGTQTYRVTRSRKVNGQYKPVTVKAQHVSPTPAPE